MGKRVLVVEDEYFIATDLARALEKEAVIVIGPAGDLAKGLSLIDGALDAAILDVNLEGSHSYAIADQLAERSVPVMFLTGYDGWALPAAYQAIPRIAKPFATKAVIDGLAALLGIEDAS